MADRRRLATAVTAYDHVCHLLALSARPLFRSILSDINPSLNSFSTRKLSFSDPHAVALSACLLIAHNASWPLVRRYLRAYVQHSLPDLLASFDALAVSPFANTSPNTASHPSPVLTSTANPLCTVDFSFNFELTSQGAAAILAACLLIPRHVNIEVYLTICSSVSSLPLAPWLSLIQVERARPERHHSRSTLTGLCLDACPLASFDPQSLAALSNLSWISLRASSFSNLWRTSEMLHSLSNLKTALFRGHVADNKSLHRTRQFARSCASSEYSPIHSVCDPVHDMLDAPVTELDVAKTSSNRFENNTTELEMFTSLIRKSETPVTRHCHFRPFLLSATPTKLHMLDGEFVTQGEREEALITFQTHFDHPSSKRLPSKQNSITGLLRNREVGLFPRRAADISVPQKERPQKRRRTSSQREAVTDIMAAVAAAGMPSGNGISKLHPSTSLTVALAASTSAEANAGHAMNGELLARVREAALRIEGASERERLSMLASGWPKREEVSPDGSAGRRKLASGTGEVSAYCEDGFEHYMSSALLNRRGNPRVQYFRQGNDRPRQFEFNPANPSELVYGTELGYLVVMDEVSGIVKGSCRSGGGRGNRRAGDRIHRTSSLRAWSNTNGHAHVTEGRNTSAAVYGLSWLNRTSNLFLSGVSSGAIHVYDVNRMGNGMDEGCRYACETFDGLTSIHVNSNDSRFAVSGITRDVALFDLETGKRTETMANCHGESINVIKFAHHSPHLLLTSSFDRFVKKWDLRESRPGGGRRPIFTTRSRTDNVMACFSPDDSYMLVSAVDNEVRQYTACDGRLEREFRIPKTGSSYNFTRSYYMNNRDYIVTGSCQESVVRVYNARSGAFFAEVDVDNRENAKGKNLYVQTLRANPSHRFNFSALLTSPVDSANDLIASVDLHSR